MGNLYDQIANVGFPIAVATYLLVRLEGKLNLLTESITELTKSIMDLR